MAALNRKPFSKSVFLTLLLTGIFCFSTMPGVAQDAGIQPLRSDVGINGLTANIHQLAGFKNLSNDTLQFDGSSELEFVFHDVRLLSPRLGAGFKGIISFFTSNAKGQPGFGVGGWGVGPVIRAYPLTKSGRLQPYLQTSAVFGNNLGVGKLADTKNRGDTFRIRLGLRGGVAYRITNAFGIFVEGGPDWESSALFKADARTLQLNFGVDIYRFK